jgi:nicotinamide riboside transporter PnuC
MTWVEAIAAVCGLLCVWLTVRQNVLCWPTGLVQVVLYIGVFYQARLYSDLILHVIVAIAVYLYKELFITTGLYSVFLVLAILGYFQWRKTLRPCEVPVPAEVGVSS